VVPFGPPVVTMTYETLNSAGDYVLFGDVAQLDLNFATVTVNSSQNVLCHQRWYSTRPNLKVSTGLTAHHVASSTMCSIDTELAATDAYVLAQDRIGWRASLQPLGYTSDDDLLTSTPVY